MDDYIYILAILGGFLAGVINTLAGSGSLITLPILIFLGLPANVANGTNRLGVVLQTIVSVFTLYKRGNLELKGSNWLIVPAILGAIPGAYIAVDLSDHVLKNIIGAVMIIMLIPLIMNADKWLRESSEEGGRHKRWHVIATFVLIGAYGGFLQAGVGIMLLSGMVLLAGFTIRRANGLKNLIVLCFSIPALAVFLINDQVNWELGLLLGSGQMLGGWVAARFAMENEATAVWVRRLLILMIILSAVELFNIRAMLSF
jgi:hypothetical protein